MVLVVGCGSGDETASDAGADATTDVGSSDATKTDAGADASPDAAADVTVSDAGADGHAAASTCATTVAPDASIVYTGTTCDGTDSYTIPCNLGGKHKEVFVRIDGTAGQVWSVMAQGPFAMALWDSTNETTCSGIPNVETCAAPDAGTSGVVDGPFPGTRSDFVMFETMDPTPCGPYTIVVTLQ